MLPSDSESTAKVTEICPDLTPIGHRVSAALESRDLGDGRATLGDPG